MGDSRLASPVGTVLILQTEAWLPVTGGLNKCCGVATKMVTYVIVAVSGDKNSSVDVSH